MPNNDPLPRAAAALPHARACPLDNTGRDLEKPQWNDTPDAIADCAACQPQSQYRRGLALTTRPCEADHAQTTSTVTH